MRLDVYLPLAFTAIFGATAPTIARRLPPALATWLLSTGSLVCATASTAALSFLGWTLVAQSPDVAARGHWSTTALRAHDPVATPIAVAALVVLAVAVTRAVTALARRTSALAAAYHLAAALPAHGARLVVVDDATLPACAVPGRPGRIVIPAALLRRLDPGERRALLVHEQAHLAHHHHVHHTVAQLAAAANPLLARLPRTLTLVTERWSDEDAAVDTGRDTVARALKGAALTMRPRKIPGVVLAAASQLTTRVAALSAPPPRPVRWRVLALTAITAAAALATLEAAHDTEHLFEFAMRAYQTSHGQP